MLRDVAGGANHPPRDGSGEREEYVSGATNAKENMVSGLIPHPPLVDLVLRLRLAILAAICGAAGALLVAGVSPLAAGAVAVVAAVGGVEVGCRLTMPYVVPRISVAVLIVVLVLVVNVVRLGYPPLECLAVLLPAAWCVAELTRRLAVRVFQSASCTV
ncbi:MAG TPA: hypothetical protein VJT31_28480 [Rugosimonospora sp.]|nr:hypothetical protein [Rugosimonospora sp.]